VLAGGAFVSVGGVLRSRLAAIDLASGRATAWDPGANAMVSELLVAEDRIYVGGRFSVVGGQSRSRLAALDRQNGQAIESFRADADAEVAALAIESDTLYIGGSFSQIAGLERGSLAAVDSNGSVQPWNPGANDAVFTLALDDTTIYAGGAFTSVGDVSRNYLAALDAEGAVLNWNPQPDGVVRDIARGDEVLYIAGDFAQVGSAFRKGTAALRRSDGAAEAWNPNVGGSVNALVLAGDLMFLGGDFTSVAGQTRGYVAVVARSDATVQPWAPDADATVNTLAAGGGVLAIGGSFRTVGGALQPALAVLDVLPQATTLPASEVSTVSALLRGQVQTGDLAASLSFEYGSSLALESRISAVPEVVESATTSDVTAQLSGLLPGTTYFYRLVAISSAGISYGEIDQFTTGVDLAAEPQANPTSLRTTATSTTLNLSFNAAEPPAEGYLVLRSQGVSPDTAPIDGASYSIGQVLGNARVVSSSAATIVVDRGLQPERRYFYAIYAYNGSGTSTNYRQSAPLTGDFSTLSEDGLAPQRSLFLPIVRR
jgi:hypothetical protein